MTEENAPDTGTDNETGPTGPSPVPTQPAPRSAAGKVLGIAALVVSIAAASVAGYLWYQVKVEQRLSQNQLLTDIKDSVNTSKVEVTALEKKVDALNEQQKQLSDRVEKRVQARLDDLQSGQQTLSQRSDALSKSIEKIYADLDRNLDTWALEEVEQLLRIANNTLQLNGDVSTATTALQLADQRLEELGNPAFLEVREKLAKDIAALKSLQPVDIAGLSLRLGSMAAKVDDLPLAEKTERPISGGTGGTQKSGNKEEGSSSWTRAGRQFLDDLKQLVRIQNIEEPPKPLLTPDQRYFLFSNLRLMLSGAQIAVLRRDTATFHDNLAQAAKWIREYFDTGHEGVRQLLSDIDGMSGINLSPELPDISDSLAKLKEVKKRISTQ